ncbi:MAG: uridine kinase [Gammaproteobacteria bacterium]|nr:uridine kinase [Gammaproteobacteria bacterium]
MPQANPIMIAVAGSSGAGKTSVANEIAQQLNQDSPGSCLIISSDRYYRDQSHLLKAERDALNYDHPHTIEFPLCREQLEALKTGTAVQAPNYDFATHSRTDETTPINPTGVKVIVFEGILLLTDEANLIDLFDAKIFVESNPSVCFKRRLERDMEERGRSKESVEEQYAATVGPMDRLFVRPSRANADLVVKNSAITSEKTNGLRFNLDPVMRYLMPILAGHPPPTNQGIFNWFKTPTEITLTGHGCAEAKEEEVEEYDLYQSCTPS